MSVRAEAPSLGDRAPAFVALPGADGRAYSLDSFADRRFLAVIFIATGCPTVRAFEPRLNALQDELRVSGFGLVAINSNNPALSPGDTLAEMDRRAAAGRYSFPYVKDADGTVARAFGAVCTPHAFLLDPDRRIVYRGRVEDARNADRVTSRDLKEAVTDLVAGRPVRVAETEPFGCSIVW